MSTTRRQFIKQSGSTLLGASALSGMGPEHVLGADTAAPEGRNRPTLVAIYLRGGADSLNTIVPYSDPLYYQHRPNIAVPRDGDPNLQVIPLNKQFGLHPNMAPLLPLFERGVMAPIINVGSPHPTRSHFDAQDFMERAAPGVRQITEGWLNRFLTMTRSNDDSDIRALSLQSTLPRSLRGQHPVLAFPSLHIEHTVDTFEELYACEEDQRIQQQITQNESSAARMRRQVTEAGASTIKLIRELRQIIAQTRAGAKYPKGGFAQQMSDLAKLIKAGRGLEVAALDYSGWDLHAFQGGSRGTMALMLQDVSSTLAAFAEDLGPVFNRVLVMVMSEFGRTTLENGNEGTDHGHGGFMLMMGSRVNGRKIYGKWTGLEIESLNEERDMPVHTDFRQVFAEALSDLYGFDPFAHKFFPGYNHRAQPLGILKPHG